MSDGLNLPALPSDQGNLDKTDVRFFAASAAVGYFAWFVTGKDLSESATVGGLAGTFAVGARHVVTRTTRVIYTMTPRARKLRYARAREQLVVVHDTLSSLAPRLSPTGQRMLAEIEALRTAVLFKQISDPKVIEDVLQRWEPTFYGPDLMGNGGQNELEG